MSESDQADCAAIADACGNGNMSQVISAIQQRDIDNYNREQTVIGERDAAVSASLMQGYLGMTETFSIGQSYDFESYFENQAFVGSLIAGTENFEENYYSAVESRKRSDRMYQARKNRTLYHHISTVPYMNSFDKEGWGNFVRDNKFGIKAGLQVGAGLGLVGAGLSTYPAVNPTLIETGGLMILEGSFKLYTGEDIKFPSRKFMYEPSIP